MSSLMLNAPVLHTYLCCTPHAFFQYASMTSDLHGHSQRRYVESMKQTVSCLQHLADCCESTSPRRSWGFPSWDLPKMPWLVEPPSI